MTEGVETTLQLPREVELLANALSRIHGKTGTRQITGSATPTKLILNGLADFFCNPLNR